MNEDVPPPLDDGQPDATPLSPDWSQPPQPDAEHATGGAAHWIVPVKNPSALIGYYCSVFSAIPCLALVLGPVAIVLGLKGLKAVRETPYMSGKAHSWVAIILGSLTTLINIATIIGIFVSAQAKPT